MLELENISLRLRQDRLFAPVNLTVAAGELVTIMGPSGCGKSTLLSAIVGDLPPAFTCEGDVRLDGRSLLQIPMEQRQIGLLYQDDLLFPHMNVAENLGFALPSGLDRKQRASAIAEHLGRAGLSGYEQRDVARLSGGQRARISLLRTLMAEPRAVLLDEPFSKLDLAMRSQFREWVFDTLKVRAIPALQVTHDAQDSLDGRLYDLEQGRLR